MPGKGPFTPEDDKTINNHIPTLKRLAQLFLNVYDSHMDDDETKIRFLIHILDKGEVQIREIKTLLESKLD